jgi:hypothetical protein
LNPKPNSDQTLENKAFAENLPSALAHSLDHDSRLARVNDCWSILPERVRRMIVDLVDIATASPQLKNPSAVKAIADAGFLGGSAKTKPMIE